MVITIEVAHAIGETVYLVADDENNKYIVTSIRLFSSDYIEYELSRKGAGIYVVACEISSEPQNY